MKNNKRSIILNYLNMKDFQGSLVFKIIFVLFCLIFIVFFMKLMRSGIFSISLFFVEIILGFVVAKYIKKYGRIKNEKSERND